MGFFTDTMTVYNYFMDPETEREVWRRTIIRGVQWRQGKKELSVSNGVQTEVRVESITIDYSRDYSRPPYVEPVKYKELNEDERAVVWTLDAAHGLDILVFGESLAEIHSERGLKELSDTFQHVVTVSSVADNRNRPCLKHIKVVGK